MKFYDDPMQPGETGRSWAIRVFGLEDILVAYDDEVPFFGQDVAKKQIEPFLDREDSFPNTMILGMPGIGKTRLAQWIASKRAEPFEELLSPVNPDDIPPSGIVLLDECHRQRHPEWLFPAMASEDFSIIGATTRPELLDPAFKSRFILTLTLQRYGEEAMKEMVKHLIEDISDEGAEIYAAASAGNPRQLELLVEIANSLGWASYEEVLSSARITGDGLTESHLRVLEALQKAGRPIGVSTVASMLYSDEQSIKEAEQYLVELDLVELRSNGRILTRGGKRYLKALEQT